MKKVALLILLIYISLLLVACNSDGDPLSLEAPKDSSTEEKGEQEGVISGMNGFSDGKLFVNHVELASNTVKFCSEKQYAELPALAILRALDVETQWEGNEILLTNGSTSLTLDVSKEDFGLWIIDAARSVRRQEGEELILDDISTELLVVYLTGGKVTVDYEARKVDVWVPNGAYSLTDASLIINGEDATGENYVKLDLEYRYAELPLLAVLRALGAEIALEGTEYQITYRGEAVWTLDTAKIAYNYPAPPGTDPVIRKTVGGELIFDDTSARLLLGALGASLTIDYQSLTVYVNGNG